MKFLTGDDIGILKWVRVEAQKVERFGPQRRGDAVERLCWAGPTADEEARVVVGHASGTIEARDSASGKVLASAALAPGIRCLEPLRAGGGAGGLLGVSRSGSAGVVAGWCGSSLDVSGNGDGDAAANGSGEAGSPAVQTFELPGPVSDARADPCGSERLVFGGGENDVKLWDLAKSEVVWRAKNVRESTLCLRVPVKVSCLQWATRLAPSRSLILCGTGDGKVRLYDANTQRRPLFELVVGHGAGAGTGGYTGTVDEQARPLNCSSIATVRGDNWGLFVGNTMGVLREFDLRNLSTCASCPFAPGRKAHLNWAAKQMPFRRGYRGIMGSIRDVDVHSNGEALVAVGIGRFAYVFDVRKRRMSSKVYLKQKLCSVLMSGEEQKVATKNSDDEESDAEGEDPKFDGPEGSEDEIKEGFSDDEEADEADEVADAEVASDADEDPEDDDDDGESGGDEEGVDGDRKGGKRRANAPKKVERQQTTVIMPDHGGDSAAAKPKKKRKLTKKKKVAAKATTTTTEGRRPQAKRRVGHGVTKRGKGAAGGASKRRKKGGADSAT